jgi:hypothetical protein
MINKIKNPTTEYTLIETVANDKWDKFVNESSNGTIFSTSTYLKGCDIKYKLFYCYKKDELRAAVATIENENENSLVLDDFIIYNGIMYNKPTNKQNHSQQFSEQFKIQEFILKELTNIYKNIELRLHPSIVDIRGILWINFGTKFPKYTPDIRYTSYLDISDFRTANKLEDISIYKKASTSRRQQIRYAIKKEYQVKTISDISLLVEFYRKTMNRQNIEVENQILNTMKNLVSILLDNNMGKIYASYDEFNEIGSIVFFAWDTKRAYYIFGANDPVKRDGHSGTNVLWETFYDLSKMGINEVDLEGINSPKRGWFKLSFGGDILPYYEVKYRS